MVKKKSYFSGHVRDNAQAVKTQGSQYGYLNLPHGVSIFSPDPDGRYDLDFIPYIITNPKHPDRRDDVGRALPGNQWWKRPFRTHRRIGSSSDTVVCLTSFGERCPICEYRARLIKEGGTKTDIKNLKTSSRCLYIVMPLNCKAFDEKPHIFDISDAMFFNLLYEELRENDDFENFPDLEDGYTVRVRFTPKTIEDSKPFAEVSRIDFIARDSSYDEKILKTVPNLDDVLQHLSYEQMNALFLEIEDTAAPADDTPPMRERKTTAAEPDETTGFRKRKTTAAAPQPSTNRPVRRARKDEEPDPPAPGEDNLCIACEGSGKNTRGGICPICKGSGSQSAGMDDEPDTAEPSTQCPYGHRFGTDCEEFKECNECRLWDDCIDAKEV